MNKSLNCRELLGPQGPFSELMVGFKARDSQLEMSSLVERIAQEAVQHVIEAPSGAGKTLAYLVPAFNRKGRTIISTATHYLQAQLFQRDIPLVQHALASKKTVALLKGRNNYLCPYYLQKNIQGNPRVPSRFKLALAGIYQQYCDTGTGDLMALTCHSDLLPYVTCSSEECLGKTCPQWTQCPLMLARKKAHYADVVILNHSLLLMGSLSSEQEIDNDLPPADLIIVDEAHRLMDFSHNMASLSLSSRSLRLFFRETLKAVQESAVEQAQVIHYLERADLAIEKLFEHIPPLTPYCKASHHAVIDQFALGLLSLQHWFSVSKERSEHLTRLSKRCDSLLIKFNLIKEGDGLCWVQRRGKGFVFQNTPVSLLAAMRQFMSRHKDRAMILTSATLSTAGSADSFLHNLGMKKSQYSTVSGDINYQKNARLYLPKLTLLPEHQGYSQQLCKAIISLLSVCSGRALLLFSSHRSLQEAAAILSLDTQRQWLIQGNCDNYRLIEQFRETCNGVLLGTGSFWEGLDLSGVPLSCVVIDKLPFSSPDDPLVALRSNYLRKHGVDPFKEFILPEAAVRLRQGCGRLLRRIDEKGVIMLADPRLQLKSYGDFLLASLPQMPVIHSPVEVADFFGSILHNCRDKSMNKDLNDEVIGDR